MNKGGGKGGWPDLAGRLTPAGHVLPVRVYFEDTDFSGRVYHASYLRFMERGRSDFLRLVGVGHQMLEEGGTGESLAFAVRRIEVDYHGAARIDDLLEVTTEVRELSGARLVLAQAIKSGDETLTEAIVTIVILNREGKPRRLPKVVKERLEAARRAS